MRWLLASILSVAGVLMLTHIPQETLPRLLEMNLFDKVEHTAAYGAIALLFLLSLKKSAPPLMAVTGLLALAAIGILDEVTQPLVHRHASVMDYAADLIGIAGACMIFLVKKRCTLDTAAP